MIHVVVGTKAQLIKMAPVMREFAQKGLDYNFISTGQHRETMADILDNFQIKSPDYTLYDGPDITSVPRMGGWMARCLLKTARERKKIFRSDRHGIVLVHGDTFSTLLGALMGRVAGLKVGHVESGLRSFNLFHPFPEELTRLLTFQLSDYYFCPTRTELENLTRYRGEKVVTGANTLYDAVRLARDLPTPPDVVIPKHPYAVVTLHRFENLYRRDALERVVRIVKDIAVSMPLIFVLHKPTERKLRAYGLLDQLATDENIELRPRTDYFRFLKVVMGAEFVVSDGGSNQEECFYLGKPILLLRAATERQEGLGENCVLSKYEPDVVSDFVARYQSLARKPLELPQNPSQRIEEICRQIASE